jgi:hypothetical protein
MDHYFDIKVFAAGNDGLIYAKSILSSRHSSLTNKMIKQSESRGDEVSSFVLVHPNAAEEAKGLNFRDGLDSSPTFLSPDKQVESRSGINEVNENLSILISRTLSHSLTTFLVQDEYAKKTDSMLTEDDEVFIDGKDTYTKFRRNVSPVAIKRALALMYKDYSVAWLLEDSNGASTPLLAMISTFDGDGWLTFGKPFPSLFQDLVTY